MEPEISGSKLSSSTIVERDQLRVKRKTLQAVLEQCQRALELLRNEDGIDLDAGTTGADGDDDDDDDGDGDHDVDEQRKQKYKEEIDERSSSSSSSSPSQSDDFETAELCNILKSGVDSPNFLEKLGSVHVSVPQSNAEEGGSWDVVSETDLWEGGNTEPDQESYVLVRQEDIVDGIACFTAAYLLSLKQTKELTPNQLQDALSKTFSAKKRKGKLQKAWDGSKVIYNVASWGATAIGIYQNPALLNAASVAFWTSCRVISKLF